MAEQGRECDLQLVFKRSQPVVVVAAHLLQLAFQLLHPPGPVLLTPAPSSQNYDPGDQQGTTSIDMHSKIRQRRPGWSQTQEITSK